MRGSGAQWVIVDGYSLLHAMRPPTSAAKLETGRQRVIRFLERHVLGRAPRVTVVFDGRGAAVELDAMSAGIEVLFSPAGCTADTVIERLVRNASRPEEILVVTSDHRERDTVISCGARAVSCGVFLAEHA